MDMILAILAIGVASWINLEFEMSLGSLSKSLFGGAVLSALLVIAGSFISDGSLVDGTVSVWAAFSHAAALFVIFTVFLRYHHGYRLAI